MEVKKCHFCGKTVLSISKVCKHCGKSLEKNAEEITPVREAKITQEADPTQNVSQKENFPEPVAKPAAAVRQDYPQQQALPPQHSKSIVSILASIAAVAIITVLIAGYFIFSGKTVQQKPNETITFNQTPVETQDKKDNAPAQEKTIIPDTPPMEKPATRDVENTNAKNTNVRTQEYASINGKNVILRKSYTTSSNKLGNLDNGEIIQILDSYSPSNDNEAITVKPIKLYNSSGANVYTLPTGKAVKVINNNHGEYKVSFKVSQYEDIYYATVSDADLEFIAGNRWYKIKRQNGEEGWVYSKFVKR